MRFSSWSGDGITDGNKSDNPLYLPASSNAQITANFTDETVGPVLWGAVGMFSWTLLLVGLVGLRHTSGISRRPADAT